MVAAERAMIANNASGAHTARAFGYVYTGAGWTLLNPTAYQIGSLGNHTNSAGGVGRDFHPQGRDWISGDALHFAGNDFIYGIQGFPSGGGNVGNSALIDDDDYVANSNKTQMGVVRIPCPSCAHPPLPVTISGPQSTCVAVNHYTAAPHQTGVTYTWTVSGGVPSATTGAAIDVKWTGGAGSIAVTTSGAGTCDAVSSFINVVYTSGIACLEARESLSRDE
jgi:hypothetical protein